MKKILMLLLICALAYGFAYGENAWMDYACAHGFSPQDESRSQLRCYIHNMESWQAGATKEPTAFYLNMTPPDDMLGERYLEEDQLIQYARIPLGLYLLDGEDEYALVLSEDGVLGAEGYNPHRLYEAGSGCASLLDLAQKVLGYRPGEADFTKQQSIRAELMWQGGSMQTSNSGTYSWQAGSVVIEDAEKLRTLDALFASADFSVGSVNCPSPCFLCVEYADGSRADFAVAANSFDLFFRNGLYFTIENDIIDLFELRETDFYKGYWGG